MSVPGTLTTSGSSETARIKKLNKILQTLTDGEYDREKYKIISKLTEFDHNVGIKLVNAYFLSWYNDDDEDHECQMGEDEFLEDFFTKSLSSLPGASAAEVEKKVGKIIDACLADNLKGSHRSIAMPLLGWSEDEERYNMLHFMPEHWYEKVNAEHLLSLFDGEDITVEFIDDEFVPSTLTSEQLDELYELVPEELS